MNSIHPWAGGGRRTAQQSPGEEETCLDDEDRVDNSLLQIWELMIVHKAKLLFYFVAVVL